MDFHYSPLQAVFDAWVVVLMIGSAVVAALRLRGRRRVLVASGFALWAIAAICWTPWLIGNVLNAWELPGGPDMAWLLPLLPWLAGTAMVAAGVLAKTAPRPPVLPPQAFPPPGDDS